MSRTVDGGSGGTPGTPDRGQTLSILVVEDDAAVAELFRALLNGVPGWGATVVHDAAAAREVLRHVKVEAMLLDVNLPGLSGTELLDVLARDGWDRCPVVLTSADERQERIDAALARHQNARFLRKPFDVDEVVEQVEFAVRAVNRRRSARRPPEGGQRERAAA